MNQSPRLGFFGTIAVGLASALESLARFLRSPFQNRLIITPGTSALVRQGAGPSGSPTMGTVCACGETTDAGEEPFLVYAMVVRPNDPVPKSPIDPATSQLRTGVVRGHVVVQGGPHWRFLRESGGADNEIPCAVCAAAPPQNNNRIIVWGLYSTGWVPESQPFRGITSNMTSCEAGSGCGSGSGGGILLGPPVGQQHSSPGESGEAGSSSARSEGGNGGAPRAASSSAATVADPGRVRHLIYHVYPYAADGGAVWRWNVEQLRRRISLFNGRRVIAVATGPATDPAQAVYDALAGCGCEFIEVANDPDLKEVASFPRLLEAVSGFTGPEHATFYGHAKGVTSRSWSFGPRPWAEAMYETCLDYWPHVRQLLVDHPLVGSFKRQNYGFPGSRAAWHYSGSFRWMRNADLFARNWREVDRAWTGSESHVGLHFAPEEGACLVGEFHGDGLGLYLRETWDGWAAAAVAAWKEQHHAERWQPLLLTCLLTSHGKPRFVHDAVASILGQSAPDWQLVLIDSGPLLKAGEFDRYRNDPRIVVAASGETPDLRVRVGLQGRAINEASRRGLVRGDLVCYLSDDDVYHSGAFAAFLAAARSSPWESAWYGSVDRTEVRRDGAEMRLGELPADRVAGANGVGLDGRADGMQVCHRRELLRRVPWPEEVAVAWHSDGVFLECLGKVVTIHPIAARLGRHRHTADSTFTRTSEALALVNADS